MPDVDIPCVVAIIVRLIGTHDAEYVDERLMHILDKACEWGKLIDVGYVECMHVGDVDRIGILEQDVEIKYHEDGDGEMVVESQNDEGHIDVAVKDSEDEDQKDSDVL